ncbi:MAG: chain length determinant protein tyrosine kinase EpsG [Acidiferrobacteraceae bacterium]
MNLYPASGDSDAPGQTIAARGDLTIGKLLLDAGKLQLQDAERVLRAQKEYNLRFGEAALKLGLVTEEDIQQVLAVQFNYPYLPDGHGNFSPELVAAYKPFSEEVEALRALRTQLLLRWFGQGHRALSIVGAKGGEGASYLAANLAIVFSQLGEKTLLIDADLRKPRQHRLFNLGDSTRGLSDMLAERSGHEAIKAIDAFVSLSVLTAGTLPPNPGELLSRTTLARLLSELSKQFDVILIDTHSASQPADFQSVAAGAGAALLVTRRHTTRVSDVAMLKETALGAGATVIGAVVVG